MLLPCSGASGQIPGAIEPNHRRLGLSLICGSIGAYGLHRRGWRVRADKGTSRTQLLGLTAAKTSGRPGTNGQEPRIGRYDFSTQGENNERSETDGSSGLPWMKREVGRGR